MGVKEAIADTFVPGSGEIIGLAGAAGAAGGKLGFLSKIKSGVGGAFSKGSGLAAGAGYQIAGGGIQLATSYNTFRILIGLFIGILTWVLFDRLVGTKTWVTILTALAVILGVAVLFKPTRNMLQGIILVLGGPLIFGLTYNFFPDFNPLFMLLIMVFWCLFTFMMGAAWFDPEHKNKAGVLFFFFNVAVYLVFIIPISSSFIFAMLDADSPLKYSVENQQKEWSGIWDKVASGAKRAQMEAKRQVNIASGNYEAGVEAQSQKPLGIFLENTGTNSPVRQGEALKIFGYLKAVTPNPKDVFKINAQCYPVSAKESKNKATFYPPGDELSAGDYKSVDCSISTAGVTGTIGSDSTQAVLETTFDFKTSAFVKTYFMEQDVIRSYRMQNLDPLDEYKIQDKNPMAVYTGGPLMVGMRAGLLQPVPLVKNSDIGPSLDITLDRTAQWPEGDLMKINKLTVYLPPGLKLVDAKACRDEAGSQVCDLKPEEYVKSETDKPIIMPAKLRFETKLDGDIQKILGGAPLAVHSFKLDAEYTFRIKKTFDVKVTQISTGALT
jgi:hypothetical protein